MNNGEIIVDFVQNGHNVPVATVVAKAIDDKTLAIGASVCSISEKNYNRKRALQIARGRSDKAISNNNSGTQEAKNGQLCIFRIGKNIKYRFPHIKPPYTMREVILKLWGITTDTTFLDMFTVNEKENYYRIPL